MEQKKITTHEVKQKKKNYEKKIINWDDLILDDMSVMW